MLLLRVSRSVTLIVTPQRYWAVYVFLSRV